MSRINTNVSALQTITQLYKNQSQLAVSLERLSSGFRINRGADDPAGLIASEALRAEARGIETAIDNSSRAINVISTADAALGEVSKLLLDIKSLVNASSSSGSLSDEELQANQLQIDSLLESINRVANSTQFNGKKLLNGELSYTVSGQNTANLTRLQIFGARIPANTTLSVGVQVTQSAQTAVLNLQKGTAGAGLSATGFTTRLSSNNSVSIEVRGRLGTEIFSFTGGTTTSSIVTAINGFKSLTGVSATLLKNGLSAIGVKFNSTSYGSDEFVSVRAVSGNFTVNPGDNGDTEDKGRDAGVLINGQAASVSGLNARLRNSGLDVAIDLSTSFGTTLNATSTFGIKGGGANFQIGPTVNSDGLVSIGIPALTTSRLGTPTAGYLNSIGTGGSTAITDTDNHAAAAQIVQAAISQVAVLSGRLGGFQANQIETNLNSQRVALENVKASESSIRDTDYASEVSNLTRAQILVQSTTTILGLANQIPQSVLSLLR